MLINLLTLSMSESRRIWYATWFPPDDATLASLEFDILMDLSPAEFWDTVVISESTVDTISDVVQP